jgi:homoserine dehydrogenase
MADSIRFAIVGFGNIGAGVVEVFSHNRAAINARLPRPLELVRLADKDLTTPRPVPVPPGVEFTDNVEKVVRGDDVDIVVELVGGLRPARQFVEAALKGGKHVVTANKALLADCGAELWALAAKHGVSLLFEASVGGGIPVIRALQQGLAANQLLSVRGILNGTCNFILSSMAATGAKFAEALEEAKRLGYAESDPTFDIEGYDTAHKIAILASLAFGQDVRFSDVYVEGITHIRAEDIASARETGHAVKLLAVARCDGPGEAVEVRVHPALVPLASALGRTDGVLNAIEIVGNAVGPVTLVGRGAGRGPTASAVLSDVMNIAQQMVDGGAPLDRRLKVPVGERNLRPMRETAVAHALQLSVLDREDTVATIQEALRAERVDVARVVERSRRPGEYFNLTIFTKRSSEARLQAALNRLAASQITVEPPTVFRVEESA